jgi:hypothetical protein
MPDRIQLNLYYFGLIFGHQPIHLLKHIFTPVNHPFLLEQGINKLRRESYEFCAMLLIILISLEPSPYFDHDSLLVLVVQVNYHVVCLASEPLVTAAADFFQQLSSGEFWNLSIDCLILYNLSRNVMHECCLYTNISPSVSTLQCVFAGFGCSV